MKRKYLITTVVVVVVLWIGVPLGVLWRYGQPDGAGEFGDTFGVVNALFSALVLVLLVYTAWMQRQQLKLQHDDNEMAREQLMKAAEAQAHIAKTNLEQLQLIHMERRLASYTFLAFNTAREGREITGRTLTLTVVVSGNPLVGDEITCLSKGFTFKHTIESGEIFPADSTISITYWITEDPKSSPDTRDVEFVISYTDVQGNRYNQSAIVRKKLIYITRPIFIESPAVDFR